MQVEDSEVVLVHAVTLWQYYAHGRRSGLFVDARWRIVWPVLLGLAFLRAVIINHFATAGGLSKPGLKARLQMKLTLALTLAYY